MGHKPTGNGRWGHADLAGSMLELTRDAFDSLFYADRRAQNDDVINLDTNLFSSGQVVARGGSWVSGAADVRAVSRENPNRVHGWNGIGVRCAREP